MTYEEYLIRYKKMSRTKIKAVSFFLENLKMKNLDYLSFEIKKKEEKDFSSIGMNESFYNGSYLSILTESW